MDIVAIVILAVVVLLVAIGVAVSRQHPTLSPPGAQAAAHRGESQPAKPGARAAAHRGVSQPLKPGELACPLCAHSFRPPDVTVMTTAQAKRYGKDSEQCPRCSHIWTPPGRPGRSTIGPF
ncbi:hypothetical protein [Actinokineospora sp.]|uniref:hypothetical protein n=1 Tax=Actinokineospora sp. TaxID=1872133 RepID=UPI0040383481